MKYLYITNTSLLHQDNGWHYLGMNTSMFDVLHYNKDLTICVIKTAQEIPQELRQFLVTEREFNNLIQELESLSPEAQYESQLTIHDQLLDIKGDLVDRDFRINNMSSITYRNCKTFIDAGRHEYNDILAKLDVFLLGDRITIEEYNELVQMMNNRKDTA